MVMARVARARRVGKLDATGCARATRHAVFACTAGLLISAGCTDLFGFQGATSVVQCVQDSDCQGNLMCTSAHTCAQCVSSGDCEKAFGSLFVCSEGTCRTKPEDGAADAGTDASIDRAFVDSAPDVDAAPPVESADCGDVAICGPCGNESAICCGPYLPGGNGTGNLVHVISDGGADGGYSTLAGIIIHVATPGRLIKLGMLSGYGGVLGYLGLYTSVDGQPGELLVSTEEFMVNGPAKVSQSQTTEVDVSPTPVTDCTDYWILGTWQSDIYLEQSDPAATPACVPLNECVAWYSAPQPYGSLPKMAPQDILTSRPQPILYAVFAQ
jgi:hypothetical protein